MKRYLFFSTILICLSVIQIHIGSNISGQSSANEKQQISRAFELRYVSSDPAADGETDFKGETEVFDTEMRVEYLGKWAEYGKWFFDDPYLNRKIVHDNEVAMILDKLKPQPLPEIRQKINLDNWKYLGYREGQREEEALKLKQWLNKEGASIADGQLILKNNSIVRKFPGQPWRLQMSWRAKIPETYQRATFQLSDHVVVGFNGAGRFFYVVDGVEIPVGDYIPGEFYDFKIELDPDGGLVPDMSRTDVEASSEDIPELGLFFPASYATIGWNYWMAETSEYPQWIAFDLGGDRELSGARLAFCREGDRFYNFRMEMSADKKKWFPVTGSETSSLDQWTDVSLTGRNKGRYVRVFYTGASDPAFRAALSMAEFYDKSGRVPLASDEKVRGKYNFYVNGKLLADYVPLSSPSGDWFPVKTDFFGVETAGEVVIDNIWGVGYDQVTGLEERRHPFFIETFIDQDFKLRPDPYGFNLTGYDDSDWEVVPYPRYAHGGERRRGESLYLRKTVQVGDYERAVLNIETVRPSAELYVNGEYLKRVGRYPEQIDITSNLKPHQENLIAVKVDPYRVDYVRDHMSSDPHTGWFAGLMDIELTATAYIKDVFAYTVNVDDPAHLRLEVEADSYNSQSFNGNLITRVYKWYPEESDIPSGESSRPVKIEAGTGLSLTENVIIPEPGLWTTGTPRLYKVHLMLQDMSGNIVDDYVVTTGLRTVSQDGGTFRINNRPEMLNGPLIFGHHYPMERIAQWMFSPPKSRWVHDILLTKKMNGNALRMSVHDKWIAGVNDRRLAQIGDQMGIMFMWQTPAWIRVGTTENFDLEGLHKYVKPLRNHPSIVVWQPGNHPRYTIDWFQQVHDSIARVDQSRLISPSADMTTMTGEFNNTIAGTWFPADDDKTYPVWTSPLLGRGTMERVLGYGQDWTSLRNIPGMHEFRGLEFEVRTEYLESNTHAWFDYESEETIAQVNWNLSRGKPWHRMYSYEIYYDKGSIGRILGFDEWQESQAWQALTVYEAYRKKRWLDFDGLNWCPLRGGGNTATYMKPLLDYQNHAKLGYHAMEMVFQPVLAGSKNVDIVYGPGDTVPVIVMNKGESRKVDVHVLVKTIDGNLIAETSYNGVELPEGREVVDLGNWMPELEPGKYYIFEYIVVE
jgi:hypothetical protein